VGLNAYLTVIARSDYRKFPRVNPTPLAEFALHKGWTPVEAALHGMPKPLGLALRGDRPTLEEFEDDWDAYDAFVTPALARKIDAALARVSDDEFIAALKAAGWSLRKREFAEHLAAFGMLKAAYREAAKRGAYLRVFIC
jgi:hypothetical protein